MRDFSTPRTYILSAYQGLSEAHDLGHHCDLVADLSLEGIPFRECIGSFEGAREESVIIVGAEHEDIVQSLAESFNQKSYLVVTEHDRTAYLVDTVTGYHKHVGPFRAVGDEAPPGDWTELDGVYFTTRSTVGVDLPRGL